MPSKFIIYFAYTGSLIFLPGIVHTSRWNFSHVSPRTLCPAMYWHLCQEAVWLSSVPSCQNIQNWAPCFTHSFLCLVSQISLNSSTINSASQARHLLYPDAKGVFSKLHIRSQCCLLNSSVIPDHLWNYVQMSSEIEFRTQSGLASSSLSDPDPFVPSSSLPSSTMPHHHCLPHASPEKRLCPMSACLDITVFIDVSGAYPPPTFYC